MKKKVDNNNAGEIVYNDLRIKKTNLIRVSHNILTNYFDISCACYESIFIYIRMNEGEK